MDLPKNTPQKANFLLKVFAICKTFVHTAQHRRLTTNERRPPQFHKQASKQTKVETRTMRQVDKTPMTDVEQGQLLNQLINATAAAVMRAKDAVSKGELHPYFHRTGKPNKEAPLWATLEKGLIKLLGSDNYNNERDENSLTEANRELLATLRLHLFELYSSFAKPKAKETTPWLEHQLEALLAQKTNDRLGAVRTFPLLEMMPVSATSFSIRDALLAKLFTQADLGQALRDVLPKLSPTFAPDAPDNALLKQLEHTQRRRVLNTHILESDNPEGIHELQGWLRIDSDVPLYSCIKNTVEQMDEEEHKRASVRIKNLATLIHDGYALVATNYLAPLVAKINDLFVGHTDPRQLAAKVRELTTHTSTVRPTEASIIEALDDAIVAKLHREMLDIEERTEGFRESRATEATPLLFTRGIDDPAFINWDAAMNGTEDPFKLLAHAQALIARRQFNHASRLPALTGIHNMDLLNTIVQTQEKRVTTHFVEHQGRATMQMTDLHTAMLDVEQGMIPLSLAQVLSSESKDSGTDCIGCQVARGMNAHIVRKLVGKPSPFDDKLSADQFIYACALTALTLNRGEERNTKGSSLAQVMTGLDEGCQSAATVKRLSRMVEANGDEINRLMNPGETMLAALQSVNTGRVSALPSEHGAPLNEVEQAQMERLKASGEVGEMYRAVTKQW